MPLAARAGLKDDRVPRLALLHVENMLASECIPLPKALRKRFWRGDDEVVEWVQVLLGLSGKYSDSCDDDSLAASTFECRAGSGRAWIGKCGREGEDCTNMVCMKVAMLWARGRCVDVLSLVQLLSATLIPSAAN